MSFWATDRDAFELKHVGIIIVNYNSTHYLLKCLDSIYHHLKKEIKADIHVVDNASAENTDIIKIAFPRVIVHKNRINVGFAKAVNQCIKKIAAPYVLLLNPDTIIGENFFDDMLEFIAQNPHVAIVGPRIMEINGRVQGSARAFPTALTALFGRNTLLSRLFPDNSFTTRNVLTRCRDMEKAKFVDWVSGACMLVRRSAVSEVGMLDEGFFMYWEDADWCKRMAMHGWRIVYFPDVVIMHHVGGSCEDGDLRPLIEFHRSVYRYFCKHSFCKDSIIVKSMVFGALMLRFYVVFFVRTFFNGQTNKHSRLYGASKNNV